MDDTAAGDTNGDRSSSSPSVGNWGTVQVRAGGRIDIDYVDFSYAITAIEVEDGTLIADNIFVSDTRIAIVTQANDSPNVNNLTTSQVEFGGVTTGGAVTNDTQWGVGNAPVIVAQDVTVSANTTLTISPGTIIKFINGPFRAGATGGPTGLADLIVRGTLDAQGTVSSPITFTSLRDDAVGGDTNGDGGNNPSDGDWGTIVFEAGSNALTSQIQTSYFVIQPVFPTN